MLNKSVVRVDYEVRVDDVAGDMPATIARLSTMLQLHLACTKVGLFVVHMLQKSDASAVPCQPAAMRAASLSDRLWTCIVCPWR